MNMKIVMEFVGRNTAKRRKTTANESIIYLFDIFCHGTFKKLVRNSEFSRSDNFKKLSVLAQVLSFL